MPLTHGESHVAEELEAELADAMFRRHGPLMGGLALYQALGYPSAEAFRQSHRRRTLPIPVFQIPSRRGRYALTQDIARWLARQRIEADRSLDLKKGETSMPD